MHMTANVLVCGVLHESHGYPVTRIAMNGLIQNNPCIPGSQPIFETTDRLSGYQSVSMPAARLADKTVLYISMVMVIGPTPPGTGVISEAFSLTAWKSTSPTSR